MLEFSIITISSAVTILNDSVKNIETELKSQPIRCRYNDEVKVNEIRYWANKNGYNGAWDDISGKTFYIGKVVAYTER